MSVWLEDGKLLRSGESIPLPPELAEIGDKDLSHSYFWSAFTMIGSPLDVSLEAETTLDSNQGVLRIQENQ